VIPGIVAMVRLIFVDVIVAVDADLEDDVLGRSRKLAQGRRWRIFLVLLPMLILDLAAMFLVLDRVQAVTHSRAAFAIADSVLAVAGQLTTVAVLLMYLGTTQKRVTKLKPWRSNPKES
jgi:small-conductance mechanosensitive channel